RIRDSKKTEHGSMLMFLDKRLLTDHITSEAVTGDETMPALWTRMGIKGITEKVEKYLAKKQKQRAPGTPGSIVDSNTPTSPPTTVAKKQSVRTRARVRNKKKRKLS